MKSYAVTSDRKARTDIGKCVSCGGDIKAGDTYKYANPTPFLSGRVFFCGKCEVNQMLIGKNTKPQNQPKTDVEVMQKVEEIIGTSVEEVERTLIEPMPAKKTVAKKVKKTIDQPIEEPPDNANKSVFCTKCKGTHVIGSRRYRQHKMYLSE